MNERNKRMTCKHERDHWTRVWGTALAMTLTLSPFWGMARKLKRAAEQKVRSGRIIVWGDRHEMGAQSAGMQGAAEGAGVEKSKPNPSWCQLESGASLNATTVSGVGDLNTENESARQRGKGQYICVWLHSTRECLGMEVTISLLWVQEIEKRIK